MARIVILATMLLLVATLAWSSVYYFRFRDRLKLWYRLTIYACLAIHAAAIGLPLTVTAVGTLAFWLFVYANRRRSAS